MKMDIEVIYEIKSVVGGDQREPRDIYQLHRINKTGSRVLENKLVASFVNQYEADLFKEYLRQLDYRANPNPQDYFNR